MHVKKNKELDYYSPTKNNTKDTKVVTSQLIKGGRYSAPNLLEGIYAELEGAKLRDQLIKQHMSIEGLIRCVQG